MRWTLGLCCAVQWAALPDAAAYCRARTCQNDPKNDVSCREDSHRCISEGEPLVYDSPCLTFAVGRGKAIELGLTDETLHDIVQHAFERWQQVDCGHGKTPGVFVQSAGLVSVQDEFFCPEPELNQAVWLLQNDWTYGADAVGNTGPIFETSTGEILDADVELNLARIKEMPSEDREEILLSIATHEAGHFLGLAHSDVRAAIMFAQYGGMDLKGRTLTPDDIDGICAIFPPEGNPKRCPKAAVSEAALNATSCDEAMAEADVQSAPAQTGCSTATSFGSAHSAFGAPTPSALVAFGALLALRKRRRQGPG